MEYNFREIEKKWQEQWALKKTYKTQTDSSKPKFYVLDMFPYPSGAGLHVGHPLGYIASDIFTRYKRMKGFNVLHPMGYDSFGLPAEQYAIQTGQHPAITTDRNIARYREQLDKIGFSFDWDREVRTSDPSYYKWTQWIFIQLFNSWYNRKTDKAEPIAALEKEFAANGNGSVQAVHSCEETFSGTEWTSFNEKKQQQILLDYRLTYLKDTMVNWCPALGTVLANEEVKDGVSERGGYPVIRKEMKQWSMRITAYSERLLKGLEKIDWPESIKEAQKNWIGKSEGSSVFFSLENSDKKIEVFTTRPDTIFGATFLTLAPEHELVDEIVTIEKKAAVSEYIEVAKNRSERERMADVKKISGVFTGAYAIHPFTNEKIEIWVGDYVLAGYGTGAVMAVPGHDSRDYAFARHFNIPIKEVVKGGNLEQEAYEAKEGEIINSGFLNGLNVKDAIKKAIDEIEKKQIGKPRTNYRLRDAIFSRQRYWGEPIPVYFKDDVPYTMSEDQLPLVLPDVDKYLPTEEGEPPLARAKDWKTKEGHPIETNTMPGWAGSSWYYLRYMDPNNEKGFAGKDSIEYWKNVDLYVGGAEHATGHLLYVRFWTKFLYDIGLIPMDEPAQKLINQGMIQGVSSFVYRVNGTNKYVSLNLKDQYETTALHVDVNIVKDNVLNTEAFKRWLPENANAEFILESGKYICGTELEKMSKSKHNVVNPDDMVDQYGADTLRMYEMFLGPVEQSKPWNTNGITGVFGFIRKYWRLFHASGGFFVSDEEPTKAELKVLHKTIRKIADDIERFSFNTSISTFMICVNELTDLKCNKRAILEPLTRVLAPFAPHVTEEVWTLLGNKESITISRFPEFKEEYLVEDAFSYPVSFNGKLKFNLEIPLNLSSDEIQERVLTAEETKKILGDTPIKKVIVVPGRIVNIVV